MWSQILPYSDIKFTISPLFYLGLFTKQKGFWWKFGESRCRQALVWVLCCRVSWSLALMEHSKISMQGNMDLEEFLAESHTWCSQYNSGTVVNSSLSKNNRCSAECKHTSKNNDDLGVTCFSWFTSTSLDVVSHTSLPGCPDASEASACGYRLD